MMFVTRRNLIKEKSSRDPSIATVKRFTNLNLLREGKRILSGLKIFVEVLTYVGEIFSFSLILEQSTTNSLILMNGNFLFTENLVKC